MKNAIELLVDYAVTRALIPECERRYRTNLLYGAFCPDGGVPELGGFSGEGIQPLLDFLCDEAVRLGRICDTRGSRDGFDTLLMGLLTPPPGAVIDEFARHYAQAPVEATDWFYRLNGDVNYIRRERITRDMRWEVPTQYGNLEISINLSKPEKDPRDIAAAGRSATQTQYPACPLCAENEGYAGGNGKAARQNLRILPVRIGAQDWGLQYSPYVYYDEHCIVLNMAHTPMRIDEAVFGKLFDFLDVFPHYFVGSNADLPIVGGSILSHEHFQGGRHRLPMAAAATEYALCFPEFPQIRAGILHWPMSVLRLSGTDRATLCALAGKILAHWRGYTDASAAVLAQTDGQRHNTITPIARKNGEDYELDLVLRNNRTTAEHPLGLFHPHEALHHIKKENIGLIEVQGLAILPARLKTELAMAKELWLSGGDLSACALTAAHAPWLQALAKRHPALSAQSFDEIIRQEIGEVFCQVLCDAGVFKATVTGRKAFLRFIAAAGGIPCEENKEKTK